MTNPIKKLARAVTLSAVFAAAAVPAFAQQQAPAPIRQPVSTQTLQTQTLKEQPVAGQPVTQTTTPVETAPLPQANQPATHHHTGEIVGGLIVIGALGAAFAFTRRRQKPEAAPQQETTAAAPPPPPPPAPPTPGPQPMRVEIEQKPVVATARPADSWNPRAAETPAASENMAPPVLPPVNEKPTPAVPGVIAANGSPDDTPPAKKPGKFEI